MASTCPLIHRLRQSTKRNLPFRSLLTSIACDGVQQHPSLILAKRGRPTYAIMSFLASSVLRDDVLLDCLLHRFSQEAISKLPFHGPLANADRSVAMSPRMATTIITQLVEYRLIRIFASLDSQSVLQSRRAPLLATSLILPPPQRFWRVHDVKRRSGDQL